MVVSRGEYGNYRQFFNKINEFINLTRPELNGHHVDDMEKEIYAF